MLSPSWEQKYHQVQDLSPQAILYTWTLPHISSSQTVKGVDLSLADYCSDEIGISEKWLTVNSMNSNEDAWLHISSRKLQNLRKQFHKKKSLVNESRQK